MKELKEEIKKLKKYFSEHYKQIIFLLILAVLTYSIKIFNYSISIDTEVTINDLNANDFPWIATGRWGVVFLEKLLHYGVRFNPMFSNIIMIIFFTLSVVMMSYLLSKIINKKKFDNLILFILGGFVLTSPTIAEMLNFTLMTGEIAIGIFLVTLSVYATYMSIYENKKAFYLITIISLIISMGEYQAFFPLYIGLVAFVFVLEKSCNKEDRNLKLDFINIIKMIGIFILSYIICSIITKILEVHFGLNPSSYLTNQITWGKIPIIESIRNIYRYIKSTILTGTTNVFFNYSFLFIIIGSLIYMIYLIIKKKKKSIISVLALLFVLASPFLIVILTGSSVAMRTQMNLPFVVGLIMILLLVNIKDSSKLKYVIYIASIIFIMIQFKCTNDLFYSDYMRYQEDERLAQSIFDKIDVMDELPEENREKVTIIFIGMHSSKSTGVIAKGDTMSYSFFEWDPSTEFASNKRIYGFSQTLGYKYIMPTKEEVKKAQELANELEIYPSNDSIKVIDNLVIVRLS